MVVIVLFFFVFGWVGGWISGWIRGFVCFDLFCFGEVFYPCFVRL